MSVLPITLCLLITNLYILRTVHTHNDTELEEYVYAWCEMEPNNSTQFKSTHNITGMINIKQWNEGGLVDVTIDLVGFDGQHSGDLYEFHVHEFGDLSGGCETTGAYFNPFESWVTHVGDWGSVPCDENGAIRAQFEDVQTSLLGYYSVLGRSIVVHERAAPGSSASPDIWTYDKHKRLACCVIHAF